MFLRLPPSSTFAIHYSLAILSIDAVESEELKVLIDRKNVYVN